MDMPTTLAWLAAAVALGAFAGWRGAQKPNPLKGPRLIPWRLIMLTAALLVILLLVHVVSLLGLKPAP